MINDIYDSGEIEVWEDEPLKRKILITSKFGAGWSTWNEKVAQQFMAEYQPIIAFLENGGDMLSKEGTTLTLQCEEDTKKRCHVAYVCTLGAENLVVQTVLGLYKIFEYDGREFIVERDADIWM